MINLCVLPDLLPTLHHNDIHLSVVFHSQGSVEAEHEIEFEETLDTEQQTAVAMALRNAIHDNNGVLTLDGEDYSVVGDPHMVIQDMEGE